MGAFGHARNEKSTKPAGIADPKRSGAHPVALKHRLSCVECRHLVTHRPRRTVSGSLPPVWGLTLKPAAPSSCCKQARKSKPPQAPHEIVPRPRRRAGAPPGAPAGIAIPGASLSTAIVPVCVRDGECGVADTQTTVATGEAASLRSRIESWRASLQRMRIGVRRVSRHRSLVVVVTPGLNDARGRRIGSEERACQCRS
jgi:hypothetical protein